MGPLLFGHFGVISTSRFVLMGLTANRIETFLIRFEKKHSLRVLRKIYHTSLLPFRFSSKTPSLFREAFKNYLAYFFPLRGRGDTSHSAKLFWAQRLSVKGGGVTPNSAKEKLR